jgi:hypothetical protein
MPPEAPMDKATGGDSDDKALVLAEAPLSDTNLVAGWVKCHEIRRQTRKIHGNQSPISIYIS